MIESQVDYILQLIRKVDLSQCSAIEVKQEQQDRFNQKIQQQLQGTVWQAGGCVSWYQTQEGKNFSLWPTYTWQYWLQTRKVDIADYHLWSSRDAKKIAV